MDTVSEDTVVTSRRFKVLIEWDADDRVWVTHVPALNYLSPPTATPATMP